MTEAEWLKCTDPRPMLNSLGRKVSDRKLRLFGVACCRRIWHLLDEQCRQGLVVAERFADNLARDPERKAARKLVRQLLPQNVVDGATLKVGAVCAVLDAQAYFAAFSGFQNAANALLHLDRIGAEKAAQADLLRDIVGSRSPGTIDRAWLTWNNGTIRALARAIYDDCTFEQAPILADALEDAGCMDAALLDHLRRPGAHVRGCWAVDAVLGKS